MDYTLNIVSKIVFVLIFKHSLALKSSWKIFHGVLENTGKVLDFFCQYKNGNPAMSITVLHKIQSVPA